MASLTTFDEFCLDCKKKLPRRRKSRPRKTGRCPSCSARYRNLKGELGPPRTGKTVIHCFQCGRDFEVYPSGLKVGRKYCSRRCASNANYLGVIVRVCLHCKEEFIVGNTLAGKKRLFCSSKCGFDSHRSNVTCLNCGDVFTTNKYETERGYGKYCSKQCCTEHLRGENHPRWSPDRTSSYSADFNETFKRMIRERDNCSCAVCRMYGIDVHHIDYNKKNTSPWNCIVLCRKCHSVTSNTRKRSYWSESLSTLLHNRMGNYPLFYHQVKLQLGAL